ncbi:MAG TPA: ImmA/IrrE family metallo-endopeptidase [Isosphaeraceae bacterium]|jgi:hypothetical protein|nr:ImmA/IrrE family metallo-endopeptidase [Isosphaeraceae bacterium]
MSIDVASVYESYGIQREDIERLALAALQEARVEPIPPIDPIVVAVRLDIPVQLVEFEDRRVVGKLVRRGGAAEILVRDRDSLHQKCFIVAHELGHARLHAPPSGDFEFVDHDIYLYSHIYGSGTFGPHEDGRRRREVEANLFAGALLMPEDEVRREWEHRRSVRDVARIFDVSELALRYRIDQLGLW